jgi:hypothetical protein
MSTPDLWLIGILAVMEVVLILRAFLAWSSSREVGEDKILDISIVIPVYGWDEGLPALVTGLAESNYTGDVEVILVVDEDNPRLAELPAHARVRLHHPPLLPPGWHDKIWRMRQGLERASMSAILFMDSDVQADPDMLVRRMRHHKGLFSFSIPVYATPGNKAERLLAAFTSYSNFFLYRAAFAVVDLATAIGPSMLFTADRDMIAEALETHKDAVADDHSLAHWFRQQGIRVHCALEPVYVLKHGESLSGVIEQITRWLMLPRTVTHLLMPHAILALLIGSFLNTAATTAICLGAVLWLASAPAGITLLAFGVLYLLTDAFLLVHVEHAYTRTRTPGRPWRHLVFVPISALLQVALLLRAAISNKIPWRGARLPVRRQRP